tara:strand:- start:536 stop:1447 length:912 start_codon:yes stop_codon:yes gene_type:complete
MKEIVIITGASGNLAKSVAKKLEIDGFKVFFYSSNLNIINNKNIFYWDVGSGVFDKAPLANCSHIVHLSGYGVINKWTEENKKKMYVSRVDAANLLFNYCKEKKINIKTFVSASAIGYYGFDSIGIKVESDLPANDWLAKLAIDWEKSANDFTTINTRVIKLRISLIFTKSSGFLKPILLSMKFGVAPILGKRVQSFEWIHLDDLSSFILFSLKNKNVNGAYNLATESKTNQAEFLNVIKNKYFRYSLLIKIPTFVLRLLLGPRRKILSTDIAVSVKKLMSTGFKFQYPNVGIAIDKELKEKN